MAIRRKRRFMITGLLTAALTGGLLLGGCARGGEEEPIVPSRVVEFFVTFAAPVQDAFYYYMVIDADGDFGADGPLPVAAGPNWGNGWGTGSFTHYVEYHLGRYELYRATLQPQLVRAGGGITAISGTPLSTDAGLHTITVNSLNLGAATVAGSGAIASVTNTGFQAAGTLALSTNAAGEVIAGSVSWTPAAAGGRALTAAEQAALTTLNSGIALNPASLAPLGLTLTLATGPDLSGSQTINVAQTTASVTDRFVPARLGPTVTTQSTLPANNAGALDAGPVPGMVIVTGDLLVGQSAEIRLEPSAIGQSLGFPYDSTLPQGASTLYAAVDLSRLGANVEDISINFVATTELIFDPTVVNPDEHTYDALGRLGNDYITLVTDEDQTISDGDLFAEEEANDPTLVGPASEQQRASVDIVDWTVRIRRLR